MIHNLHREGAILRRLRAVTWLCVATIALAGYCFRLWYMQTGGHDIKKRTCIRSILKHHLGISRQRSHFVLQSPYACARAAVGNF
jgi:hypothetical protein